MLRPIARCGKSQRDEPEQDRAADHRDPTADIADFIPGATVETQLREAQPARNDRLEGHDAAVNRPNAERNPRPEDAS